MTSPTGSLDASLSAPTCPFCHTEDQTITAGTLAAGATWQCVRCRQAWSALRLATAATYERYCADRDERLRGSATAIEPAQHPADATAIMAMLPAMP